MLKKINKIINNFSEQNSLSRVFENTTEDNRDERLGRILHVDYVRQHEEARHRSITNHTKIESYVLTPKFIERSTGSYLHRFRWLNENDVGEIPKGWNHLVLEYEEKPKANILHYTVGSPCFEEFNQGIEADIWYKTYYRAMNGFNNTKNKTQIKV